MTLLKIITEPAIIIITLFFIFFLLNVLVNYSKTEKNLKSVYLFLQGFNKKEIPYRFKQLDEYMESNSYTATAWNDLKKTIIYPEKLYSASQNSDQKPAIYLTVDSSYFLNEETLIYTKINHKFIQVMPTLLTGLGPFFTFLKMAIAFTAVNFSYNMAENSLNGLISNIQMAALCSVFAVGYSLLFMFTEKILYNRKCKKYNLLIQKEFVRLFDICTSEQFLLDLVKESKTQNSSNEKVLKTMPEDFAKAVAKSINEITTPYLENILYSLNKINEKMGKSRGNDVVDKLF